MVRQTLARGRVSRKSGGSGTEPPVPELACLFECLLYIKQRGA